MKLSSATHQLSLKTWVSSCRDRGWWWTDNGTHLIGLQRRSSEPKHLLGLPCPQNCLWIGKGQSWKREYEGPKCRPGINGWRLPAGVCMCVHVCVYMCARVHVGQSSSFKKTHFSKASCWMPHRFHFSIHITHIIVPRPLPLCCLWCLSWGL